MATPKLAHSLDNATARRISASSTARGFNRRSPGAIVSNFCFALLICTLRVFAIQDERVQGGDMCVMGRAQAEGLVIRRIVRTQRCLIQGRIGVCARWVAVTLPTPGCAFCKLIPVPCLDFAELVLAADFHRHLRRQCRIHRHLHFGISFQVPRQAPGRNPLAEGVADGLKYPRTCPSGVI